MAKYINNKNNARPANNNKSATPRIIPVTKILPLVVTGVDARGNQYDSAQVNERVEHIQECSIFDILSINASLAKSICFNNADLKGQISVARIKSYDASTGNMEIIFIGKNTEFANIVDDMVIVPRVRLNRDGNVESILSFDIIPAMEA